MTVARATVRSVDCEIYGRSPHSIIRVVYVEAMLSMIESSGCSVSCTMPRELCDRVSIVFLHESFLLRLEPLPKVQVLYS